MWFCTRLADDLFIARRSDARCSRGELILLIIRRVCFCLINIWSENCITECLWLKNKKRKFEKIDCIGARGRFEGIWIFRILYFIDFLMICRILWFLWFLWFTRYNLSKEEFRKIIIAYFEFSKHQDNIRYKKNCIQIQLFTIYISKMSRFFGENITMHESNFFCIHIYNLYIQNASILC